MKILINYLPYLPTYLINKPNNLFIDLSTLCLKPRVGHLTLPPRLDQAI